jgi:NADH-quinone oxidoreductase subunit M
VANDKVAALADLNAREWIVLAALAAAVLALGIYPLPLVDVMHASVNDLLRHVAIPKY